MSLAAVLRVGQLS